MLALSNRASRGPLRIVLALGCILFAGPAVRADVGSQVVVEVQPGGTGSGEAPEAEPQKPDTETKDGKKEKPKKDGLAVNEPLLLAHCARCHQPDDRGHMSRISYLRKSPEGWSTTLKRMIRLYEVKLTPDEAKQIVRYLSNDHGLTRAEAARGLYESERRVHWSEQQYGEDLRESCAQCHTLGRVFNQQRDKEEWSLLRATHVAYFPLSRGQVGGGPPPSSEERRWMNRSRGGDSNGGNSRESRGDRVISQLSKEQPLFTPEWESWAVNRREIPLAGTWTVRAHQVGHGDGFGTATLRRTGADEYEVDWLVQFASGHEIKRTGRGFLYAGYSWRGRTTSTEPGTDKKTQWREVLLLDEDWRELRGRVFTGAYDEIGIDVTLRRHIGSPRVLAVQNRFVTTPAKGAVVELLGESFDEAIGPDDLFLGKGVKVTSVEYVSANRLRATIDVEAGTECGPHLISLGSDPGVAEIYLYDAIDYVRVAPTQGLARIGGLKIPPQYERFEAIARHRGKDGKPFTEDDVDLMTLDATWSLSEFAVRENDDDVLYVGTVDPETGAFTPGLDGPNPARKWQANNVGQVYVEAVCEVESPVRQEKGEDGELPDAPVMKAHTFRSRGRLLVTVPLYTRWNTLDWEGK